MSYLLGQRQRPRRRSYDSRDRYYDPDYRYDRYYDRDYRYDRDWNYYQYLIDSQYSSVDQYIYNSGYMSDVNQISNVYQWGTRRRR